MTHASKASKKIIRQNNVKYKRKCRNKVKNMRTKDPKGYWNYINSLNKKPSNKVADLNSLFDFFKDLNVDDGKGNEHIEADFPNVNVEHTLNVGITEEEISKATGLDNISNEYVKHSLPLL